MSEPFIIAYINSAGVAKNEQADPEGLGRFLSNELRGKGEIAAIGLAEVLMENGSQGPINDCQAFINGFGAKPSRQIFYANLDSSQHLHRSALQNKWSGPIAAPRISTAIRNGHQLFQGSAALSYLLTEKLMATSIRPEGRYPFSSIKGGDPLDYQGTRDTEPRSVIMFKNLQLHEQKIDVVFCHLETRTDEPRLGRRKELDNTTAAQNRLQQIAKINELLSEKGSGNPVVLMGDFNARPGSKELMALGGKYGFLQVFPAAVPLTTSYRKNRLSRYSTSSRSLSTIDPRKSEAEQGWPYSHLNHKILIDHAFIRGFDTNKWDTKLEVIKLPNEQPGHRLSDHRPIALFLSKRTD